MLPPKPPRPRNTIFGIRVDGRTLQTGFKSVQEAERVAERLVATAYQIEVIDAVTGETVKRLDTLSP